MGYFSSGTEGMDYQARYCERCVNYGPDEGPGCPIWSLHLLWNYDSCRDEMKDKALRHFIPIAENGVWNEQCRMFKPAEAGDHNHNQGN